MATKVYPIPAGNHRAGAITQLFEKSPKSLAQIRLM